MALSDRLVMIVGLTLLMSEYKLTPFTVVVVAVYSVDFIYQLVIALKEQSK